MKVPAPPIRILAAAGVLTLLLVGVVVRENIARDEGTEVRLALAGYDPRSLLQGHYVQFQLRHQLDIGQPCPPGGNETSWPPRRDAWVALRREGDHYAPAGQAKTRAAAQRQGEVVARGGISCLDIGPATEGRQASIELGVDRIHLDQKSAEAVEAELRGVRVGGEPPGYAVLSIGRDGKARVKGLIVGKRRVELSWY